MTIFDGRDYEVLELSFEVAHEYVRTRLLAKLEELATLAHQRHTLLIQDGWTVQFPPGTLSALATEIETLFKAESAWSHVFELIDLSPLTLSQDELRTE